MPVIAIPKVLREKLGEDGVDSLIEILNKGEEKIKEDIITLSAEKFEKKLSQEINGVRQEVKQEINGVKESIISLEGKFSLLEEKFERRLTEEIGKIDKRITEEIGKVDKRITEENSKLREEISLLEVRLTAKISEIKADLMKWMFLFWIGQLACIVGIVKFLK